MESLNLFTIIGGLTLTIALLCAIYIAIDLRSHKQDMKIMGPVWVLTGLWASILGLIAYLCIGRGKKNIRTEKSDMKMDMSDMTMKKDMKMDMPDTNMKDDMKMDMPNMNMKSDMKMDMPDMNMKDDMKMDMPDMNMNRPKWQSIGLSALHCGAGCTLADIIGESFTGLHPIFIGGSFLIGAWGFDYILALIIGVYFQYAAIREMDSKIPIQKAIEKAAKADFLSLTSWQIGMYGWMAISIFIINDGYQYSKTSVDFWFNMQIAMLCGFITAYPMNWFLIKIGLKKGM
ncbi:MAG: DUF4396 domain-containing protein [Bacteroidales bacterium]